MSVTASLKYSQSASSLKDSTEDETVYARLSSSLSQRSIQDCQHPPIRNLASGRLHIAGSIQRMFGETLSISQ